MNYWLILIPLTSALIGWLTIRIGVFLLFYPKRALKFMGITFQGVIPNKQEQIARFIGKIVNNEFAALQIEKKISSPSNLEKIMPTIESHIDEFLRVKLKSEMPMVGMFVGEKTIGKMKDAFLKEIQSLFPKIMNQFADNLQKDIDLEQIVINKISAFSSDKLQKLIQHQLAATTKSVALLGAVIGLLIGLFQVAILLFCL